jgi:hypothetical protein
VYKGLLWDKEPVQDEEPVWDDKVVDEEEPVRDDKPFEMMSL